MTPDRIIEVLQLGGKQTVEFEEHANADAVGVNVCALLNARGGYVICGVGDGGETTGVPPKAARELEARLVEGLVPKTLVSVEAHEVEGKTVLVVEVPAGKDVPYAFENQVYVREGKRTLQAGIETIKDMVMRRQGEPERWERRFSTADLERDVDGDEVMTVVHAAGDRGRIRFHDDADIQGVLQDLAVARYGRLTNAGDVLFTTTPELRNPQVRVRAVCFTADKADDTYRDQKSFGGPLVRVLEEVYRFIVRNTPTLVHFRGGELARENVPLYPPDAVREGLVNAFAHRDYADYKGGIAVHIYPHRLEIWNSGSLPKGVTPAKLAHGHISVLRNPDIAHVLYLRGMMEKVGRGSLLIRDRCAKHGMPPPEWISSAARGVTLTLRAPEGETIGKGVAKELPSHRAGTQQVPSKYPTSTQQVTLQVARLLAACAAETNRATLMAAVGMRDRASFSRNYLRPALDGNLIEMTEPDSPTSPTQKYRLTARGKGLLGESEARPKTDKEAGE